MDEIITVLISAGIGSLITGIFAIIDKSLGYKERKEIRIEKKEHDHLAKKEKAYVAALQYLLNIKRGFDYTREDLLKNEKICCELDEAIKDFRQHAPIIRLYSSDRTFRFYNRLTDYCQYSYAREDGWRLFEESKETFNDKITILSRLMQADLGQRDYDKNPDKIKCPKCKKEHDIFESCPKCGMTFDVLQEEMFKEYSKLEKDKSKEG